MKDHLESMFAVNRRRTTVIEIIGAVGVGYYLCHPPTGPDFIWTPAEMHRSGWRFFLFEADAQAYLIK